MAQATTEKPEAKTESKGHLAHTKAADDALGLPGKMQRPLKITMLGAGSTFTPRLSRDILQIPGGQGGEIALVDIDKDRLGTMHKLIEMIIQDLGLKGWKVTSSTDRRQVMAGSD